MEFVTIFVHSICCIPICKFEHSINKLLLIITHMAFKVTLSNTTIPVEWTASLLWESTRPWLFILYLSRHFLFLSLLFSSDIVAYRSLSLCLFCSLGRVWFLSINFRELQTYEHRICRDILKVYLPPCVIFVRSPKGTRSPVGLGVSITLPVTFSNVVPVK